jgi:hypothetical protein
MKKSLYTLLRVFALIIFCQSLHAQVTPPAGWGDFQVGLVNDNSNIINVRMKKALSEGVKLNYRYAYVNNGVDPNTNALSWLFNQWGTDYSKNSSDMGLRPGYVIYMLQEEGGAAALKNNILNSTFMRNYFLSVRTVAEKSNGYKAMFVIEPDTWGYFLQNALEQGLQSDPRLISANVNNLGAGYEYLSDLPNTLSGVALATIRTIHKYAPDSYCGLLMSFWDVNANGATGPPVADGAKGMVYWNQGDVDYSANRNVTFANQLLGTTGDRGNFIGVEKNGWSAGNWLVKQNRNDYYWNDTQNAKWISWSKTLRTGVNLPLLGWQISIGHMGLPNTVNRYEDTFMPYFFSHVSQYIDAGFIGFLAGKGLADCTDFTNLNGNELEANGSAGDDGWFFEKLKTFDASRPYLGSVVGPSVSITSPANNATFTSGSSITINANASAGTNCTATKVEFFQGAVKIGEDLTSPYSYTWASVASGSYTLTAKITNSCGNSAVSAAVMITVGNNPPTVSITSPANGATFTLPTTININAAASDTDGTISKVDFYNGSTLLGTDTSAPYSYAWSNVTANNYTLKAIATDNGGAATTSATVTITVANAPTQTPYGGTVRNLPGKIEAEHYDVGGEGIAYHDLSSGNTGNVFRTDGVDVEATTDTGTGYNVGWIQAGEWLEYTVNVTTAGTYTLSARVAATAAGKTFHVDVDGVNVSGTLTIPNTGGWQTWQTVTATTTSLTTGQKIMRVYAEQSDFNLNYVDFASSGNASPTTSITSPANAATFTAPASITINANASDTSPGTVSKVDFYNGTTLIGTDTSSPYSFTWTNVAAGTYSLTTKATDNQGAVGTSAAISITVNTASNPAPTTSIASPTSGATYAAPATITINANASDTSPGTVSKVDFYNGTTLLGTDTSSPYSFTWTNVAVGTYSLTTKATDNQGASATSTAVSVTVGGMSPTASITSPASGASFTAPACITINVNAQDADGTIAKVEFYAGSTKIGEDATSPFSFTWCNVAAGTYQLSAHAIDNAGYLGVSTVVAVAVASVGTCGSIPQYVENGGYSAGSIVKNVGNQYECKPWPYSGWCNGGASAYAPGTGTNWTDAWTLKGSCSARMALPAEENSLSFNNVTLFPNPGASDKEHELVLIFDKPAGAVALQMINTKGSTIMLHNYRDVKTKLNVAVPALPAGLYLMRIHGDHGTWIEKYVLHE